MKRYIKINQENFITDIFNDYNKSKFDGTEIYLDESDSPADVWIHNKCIYNEFGDPLFKYINGNITEPIIIVNLDRLKDIKNKEISNAFELEFIEGKFTSATLSIEVDYRRSATKNDMQNVIALISYMERNDIIKIIYKGCSGDKEATLPQLKELLFEMEDHGVSLYQKKWYIRSQISDAVTKEQLDIIKW